VAETRERGCFTVRSIKRQLQKTRFKYKSVDSIASKISHNRSKLVKLFIRTPWRWHKYGSSGVYAIFDEKDKIVEYTGLSQYRRDCAPILRDNELEVSMH
ncbi:unnamed protein product, partial [marine sediment metagenome]